MPVPGPSRPETSAREELEAFFETVTEDDGNRQLIKQIALGGVSGWLTGFVCQKVGKVAATALGGGIILIQIAHHKGYIRVNWNRVNRDFEQVTNKIQKEAFGKKKMDWSDKLEKKAMALANRQKSFFRSMLYTEEDKLKEIQVFSISYSVGLALGLIMGQ